MYVNRLLGAVLAAAALVISLLIPVSATAAPTPSATPTDSSASTAPAAQPVAARKAARFTPKAGITVNSPVGNAGARNAIFSKIMKSINATPRGEEIMIFSWNFLTSAGRKALLRAQKRNVRVRLLMDSNNVNRNVNNIQFKALRNQLRSNNKGRPKHRRSWARVCQGTCRGTKGGAHSKFFMFSRAGKARQVVIQGSANFTVASTNNQWNDVLTHVGHDGVWKVYRKVFLEAAKDKQAKRMYVRKNFRNFSVIHFPNRGKNVPDPVMQVMNNIKCKGAKNTGNGRTVVRISPDVLRTSRGMKLARKIRSLWNAGCNLMVGYTVIGIDVGRYLRAPGGRGPVPLRHMVQDKNGDGEFDLYFHMKVITVRGHYGKDRTGYAVLNGSANWTGVSKVSDENVGVYRNPRYVKRYEEHLSYWFNRPMFTAAPLMYGRDANAVYENGRRVVTRGNVNPFANVEMD
ncbi:phospholipase D-like domain-containing protein [Nocardioides sambongensis]|uniref:phospholipase D-like domain-containing protein n=1 Tax=Nocardioides sambongensis TaxID=2589074 RepID=UPI00112DF2C7|nr:phospholipase D-like domain-containing protein [Nocardioides sambongensis]